MLELDMPLVEVDGTTPNKNHECNPHQYNYCCDCVKKPTESEESDG